VHIIGGIDDRSSPDQYRFLRHLASFELPRLLTGHSPTVIVILDGVQHVKLGRAALGGDPANVVAWINKRSE
jgi:hypothetical protein